MFLSWYDLDLVVQQCLDTPAFEFKLVRSVYFRMALLSFNGGLIGWMARLRYHVYRYFTYNN